MTFSRQHDPYSEHPTIKVFGHQVLAKRKKKGPYGYDMVPATYPNQARAAKKATELGNDWTTYEYGRNFMIGLKDTSPDAIIADYEERAKAARQAGAVCEINTATEDVFIRDSTGEEYYHHGQGAQDFIDEANQTLRECDMEGKISLEDYFLAIHG